MSAIGGVSQPTSICKVGMNHKEELLNIKEVKPKREVPDLYSKSI